MSEEEKIPVLEDTSSESIQSKIWKSKSQNQENIQELSDTTERSNMGVMGVPEVLEREAGLQDVLKRTHSTLRMQKKSKLGRSENSKQTISEIVLI